MDLISILQKNSNLTLEDVNLILKYEGFAFIKSVKAEDFEEAYEKLFSNFHHIARGFLLHFEVSDDISLFEFDSFLGKVYKNITSNESDILVVTTTDNSMSYIKVDCVLTGIMK
ncbi:MAG: hypothetical protein ABGX26_04595 [Nautiliaceae bacterium]